MSTSKEEYGIRDNDDSKADLNQLDLDSRVLDPEKRMNAKSRLDKNQPFEEPPKINITLKKFPKMSHGGN